MGKKIRSARGEMVDFDLLKIKEQIASSPPPQDVKLRQDFIERRIRRRLKKTPAPAPKIEKDAVTEDAPKLASTETLNEEPKMIDEVKEDAVDKKPVTRQRTRKPVAKPEENKDV